MARKRNRQMNQALRLEMLLLAERPRLVRLCARLSGNRDAAEDLAQETLLQAWKHWDRLYSWDQAAAWLSGIARNVCLHWARRHYRDEAHRLPVMASDPALAIESQVADDV